MLTCVTRVRMHTSQGIAQVRTPVMALFKSVPPCIHLIMCTPTSPHTQVSGEALMGPHGFGVDPEILQSVAAEVAAATQAGVRVAIVVSTAVLICYAKATLCRRQSFLVSISQIILVLYTLFTNPKVQSTVYRLAISRMSVPACA